MSISASISLVWFRQDLRLEDNPALQHAVEHDGPVACLYILDTEAEKPWQPGGASRWWLHYALKNLRDELRANGSDLYLFHGDTADILPELADVLKARLVSWNRRYEPHIIERDKTLKARLCDLGLTATSHNAALLFEPWEIANKSDEPYQVFTPFWKQCLTKTMPEPVETDLIALKQLALPDEARKVLESKATDLESLDLLPEISWDTDFYEAWEPTTAGAQKRLDGFLTDSVKAYKEDRNRPDMDRTSALSPYLHHGQIGPRQIVAAVTACGIQNAGTKHFLSEIGWREFSYHMLFHFPKTPQHPLRDNFAEFPWQLDAATLRAWQKGQTGYPIVDAGMRQLWAIGWMHNRVRMNVASLLVKHLQQPWQEGARWFWDTLVDADLASNTQGWQWTAGCGADAAPYFRIFNPMIQGAKFDPNGDYVRKWVPELAKLPTKHIHAPWEAPESVLQDSGITLGETYPYPLIDHSEGRQRALDAYEKVKGA